ncbi:MAG: pyrroline-5-carboxylate reductase [Gammaproteobacteria bacterium]|jgi:pyrroline-5-carboxylate reductase
MSKLCFIGAGNMARSLIGGLLADGWSPGDLCVADPDAAQRDQIRQQWPAIPTYEDNGEAVAAADVVLLAVKPQILQSVARALVPALKEKDKLVISIAAGITTPDLDRWLGDGQAIARAMPNTPALVRSGATGLFANTRLSPPQRDLAETILRAVGLIVWFEDEEQLDAVTALSGSGPAYFFLVMEALQAAGEELGLTSEQARLLTVETALGAARLALESEETPADLRARVTSKGGTTERAIGILEEGGLRELMARAVQAAAIRSRELAEQLGVDA